MRLLESSMNGVRAVETSTRGTYAGSPTLRKAMHWWRHSAEEKAHDFLDGLMRWRRRGRSGGAAGRPDSPGEFERRAGERLEGDGALVGEVRPRVSEEVG